MTSEMASGLMYVFFLLIGFFSLVAILEFAFIVIEKLFPGFEKKVFSLFAIKKKKH